jgi:hypothetical protein
MAVANPFPDGDCRPAAARITAHMMKGTWCAVLAMWVLTACGSPDSAPAPEPKLVFDTRVVFVEADGRTPRAAPSTPLRIWTPTLVGDIYGSPNEGAAMEIALKSDLTFHMDLNGVGRTVEKGLVATQFSQKWMAIEPAAARVARVLPFVLEADNIAPVGTAEWLDRATGVKLMLIYVDRPARIRGDIVYDQRKLLFEIDADKAGFLWVQQPEGNGTFRAAPPPKDLVLAVFPD